MFYRVDYVLALMFAGLIIGGLVSRRISKIESARVAGFYFKIVAVLIVIRVLLFVCTTVFVSAPISNTLTQLTGDAGSMLFGALFGLAIRRDDLRTFLCDPAIYSALCISSGVGYVISGYAKSLGMAGMIEFFSQSGYSTQFLKFIMTAEVFGGIGLLLPWTAVSAVAGLSMDMCGAIYTHIHNGDPLNDSKGAIAALIRFAAIIALWAWRPRVGEPEGAVRRRFVGVAAGAVLCAAAAVAGGAAVRHFSGISAAPNASAQTSGYHELRGEFSNPQQRNFAPETPRQVL